MLNISKTNKQISKPFFSSENWDPYVNFKYRTNFCYCRGLRYLQKKTRFRNRQVHIHTDLKWSSQYQSGLEMTWLAPDCPGHTLRGPQGPQLPQLVSQGVPWPLRGQSGHLKATLMLWGPPQAIVNMYLYISEPGLNLQISHPPKIAQNWFCIQNLHMVPSFQKKKTI